MRSPRALVSALLMSIVAFTAAPAWADGDKEREADAERLFREAQKLLEERRYVEACPKFQLAYEKDGKLGTLINLAFCHKEQGANWYAWLEFREAELKATELGRKDRVQFAREQRVALEKGLPKVVLDNPKKLEITELRIEDRKIPDPEKFTAEEGQRKFVFKAKGKKSATLLVTIVPGARPQHIVVPPMEDGSDEPPPPPPTAVVDPKTDPVKAPPPPPPVDEGIGSTQRTFAFVSFGVGAAAVAAGAVTGILVLTGPCKGSDSETTNMKCTNSEKQSARTLGTVSDISFIVAGAGAVIGLTLYLTAPSAPTRSGTRIVIRPEVGLGYAGVSGSF